MNCQQDPWGFHIGPDGIRTTKRYGIDAYAYRCTECGTVGDIKDGWFVPRAGDR